MILGVGDLSYKLEFGAACALVARFWELGGREFDTAHTYAHWVPGHDGASERTLGAVLRELGLAEAVVTTKGGHPDGGPRYPRPADYLSPELIRSDLAESLARLGVGQVDCFLLHRDDCQRPVENIAATLSGLRDAGLTRRVGVSNWPLARIARLRELLDGPLVWQNQGSLAVPNWREGPDPTVRRFTSADFAWAAEHGVTCTCYSSTANGYLAKGAEVASFDNEVSRARQAAASELAAARNATANQVGLAWLLAQPGDVRPIFSTGHLEHLEEALAARQLALSASERDALAATVEP